jgi:branched-chain amino acid transport system permease protein
LQEFFKSESVFGEFAKHWHLGLGLAIIATVALLPNGLISLPGQLRTRLVGSQSDDSGLNDLTITKGKS